MAWTLPINTNNTEATCQADKSSLPRTLSCLYGYESADLYLKSFKRKIKASKVYEQVRTGLLVAQAQNLELYWGTLTESDYAIGMYDIGEGVAWGTAMHNLSSKLRTDYGRECRYCWIDHIELIKGFTDFYRHNRHFIYAGEYPLDTINLDDYWRNEKRYGSFFSKLEPIRNAEGTASYLVSKYVAHEGFQRACFSQNWVFPQWFEFNKWFHAKTGNWMPISKLSNLSTMTQDERYLEPHYFQWFLTQQDKIKQRIANSYKTESERKMYAQFYKKHPRMRRGVV